MTKAKRARGREENARVETARTENIPIATEAIFERISAVGAVEDGIGVGETGRRRRRVVRRRTEFVVAIEAFGGQQRESAKWNRGIKILNGEIRHLHGADCFEIDKLAVDSV